MLSLFLRRVYESTWLCALRQEKEECKVELIHSESSAFSFDLLLYAFNAVQAITKLNQKQFIQIWVLNDNHIKNQIKYRYSEQKWWWSMIHR